MSSGSMEEGGNPSVEMNNDKLYEKLRAHTEKLLAEQYTRLHDQFQNQLDQVLGTLRAPPRAESITVRAGIEGNATPVVVSTSTGLRTSNKSFKVKKEKKKLSKIPPHLASRYLSPAPMLVPKIPTLLKKTAKPSTDEIPVTNISNNDHQTTMYNEVKAIDLNLSEEEQSKFPSVTKAFLKKSMFLLNDIQKLDKDKTLNKPKTATRRKPTTAANSNNNNNNSNNNSKSCNDKSRLTKSAPSKLAINTDEVFEVDEEVEPLEVSNYEIDEDVPMDENNISENIQESFANKTVSDLKVNNKDANNDTKNKNNHKNTTNKERNNTDALPPRPKQSRPMTSPMKSSVPKEWTDLRLDLHSTTHASSKDDHLLSNVAKQWENQVAKHVLSLFASHKMHTGNHKEGQDILHYVDIHDEENKDTVLADLQVHSNTMYGSDNKNDEANHTKTSPASKFMKKKIGLSRTKTSDSRIKQRLLTADGEDFEKAFSKFRSCHVITTRTGEQVALRGSPKVAPIWFVANGDIFSDWSFLPGGNNLQAQLNVMYENRSLVEYVEVLKTIIIDLYRVATGTKIEKLAVVKKESVKIESPKKKKLGSTKWDDNTNTVTPNVLYSPPETPTNGSSVHNNDNNKYSPDQVREMFRKLIVSSNSMAMLAISKKQEDMACRLIQVVESYIHQDGILPKSARDDLNALIYTTWGYYFYKKRKFSSAITFTKKALELYELLENKECIAMCLTQLAAAYTLLSRPKEGHQLLYQFITMLEDGRLSVANSEARELCICAIAYHNLAVIQLKLLVPDLAIKSAQSARKIARLCISYSSRWSNVFQYTYDAALDDINFHLANGKLYDSESLKFLNEITKEYFHPVPDEEGNIIINNGQK